MQANDFAINLSSVQKTYRGRIHALRGVDMHVHRGEVFGLLGPNGAGKSTLVKIMMTVVRPTRCEGTILGESVGHKATLSRVGYLPENHRFPRYLTARQTLDLFGALAKVPRRARRERTDMLLESVGMKDWADKRVSTYSKGMMQRVGLAQALVNDPDLVLLDEPTDGVDPVGRREIRDVLVGLRQRGKTVFINSHMLSELEMVCDRVAILVNGAVARQGTMDELAITKQFYAIEPANGALEPGLLDRVRASLRAGITVELVERTIQLTTTDPSDVQPAVDVLRSAGVVIRRIAPVRPSLEDLFLDAVREQFSGSGPVPVGAQPPMSTAGASK